MLINSPNISGSLTITGNSVITGSLTVLGGINGAITGSAATASYVEYTNVANKPALVSGSSQVIYSGLTGIPSGIVSGSSQVTYSGLTGIPSGIVSGSAQITGFGIFATTGSNQFNGSQAITGSLTTTGTIVAQTLNVQQVTSSIVYSSGSNIFGNSSSDIQQFTGSLSVNGAGTFSSSVTSDDLILTAGTLFGTGNTGFSNRLSDTTLYLQMPATGFNITDNALNTRFILSSTGAATFQTTGNNGIINIGGSTYYSQLETNSILGGLKIKSVWGAANSGIIQFINGTSENIRMHIADNGNVDVGLTNATDRLTVSRNVADNAGGITLYNADTSGYGSALTFRVNYAGVYNTSRIHGDWFSGNSGALHFFTANTSQTLVERMTIDGSGNVGIGINSPSYKTHIQGTGDHRLYLFNSGSTSSDKAVFQAEVADSSSGNAYAFFGRTGAGWSSGVNVSSNKYIIRSNWDVTEDASARLIIDSSGNVGIGTGSTSPGSILVIRSGVSNSVASPESQVTITNTTSGNFATLGFRSVDSDGDHGRAGITVSKDSGSVTGKMHFAVRANSGTFSNPMTILSGGNVGIGTFLPTSRLHVNDESYNRYTIRVQSAAANNTNGWGGIGFSGEESNTKAAILFVSSGTSYSRGSIVFANNDGSDQTNASPSDERMRIRSDGTILAGTTDDGFFNGSVQGTGLYGSNGFIAASRGSSTCAFFNRYTSTGDIVQFRYAGSNVGTISTNGSTITFSGNALSDERFKENIEPIENALDTISKIEFKTFNYKENQQYSAGVTAQQLQTVDELSKYVIDGTDEESYKAVDYNALIGYLGKAIQELKAENDTLKSRIDTLEQA